MSRRSSRRARRQGGRTAQRPQPRRSDQETVRVAAAWVIERTLESRAPAATFLNGALARFDERDGALLRQLVLGTLRWCRRLDHVLQVASDRSLQEIERVLHAPLRVGAFQLLFLRRVPPYSAVDEAVEHARALTHRGGANFVNAVLRRIARSRDLEQWPVDEADTVRRLGIEFSHPDFIVERWLRQFGTETTKRLLTANNQPRPIQVLGFRDRGGREMLAEELIDAGMEIEPTTLSPLGLTVRRGNPLRSAAFSEGRLYVQDEVSQLAAALVPVRPGETVFDAVSAPGGKFLALLAAEPSARVVAGDIDLARVLRVRQNLTRLRRNGPHLIVSDAGRPPTTATFDRVIADLPCSGTGTLRKNPELKWRLSQSEIDRLARLQRRILRGLVPRVAPGGLLVVITCSLELEENDEVIEETRYEFPELEPVDLRPHLSPPADRFVDGLGRWQVLPDGDHDGFTVHVLRNSS